MYSNRCMQDGRHAIGRILSTHIALERDIPDHLKILLRRLRLNDEALKKKGARADR